MQVLLTSDLHILHKNIHKYRTIFSTAQEHHEFMIDKILSLNKRTILIILGDFLFDYPDLEYYHKVVDILSKASCRIKVVVGNHDSKRLYNSPFEIQLPLYTYKEFWLSHAPIHPQELRGRKGNIHGHLHLEVLDDLRYFNVNIDVNNYEFVTLEEIKERFKEPNII